MGYPNLAFAGRTPARKTAVSNRNRTTGTHQLFPRGSSAGKEEPAEKSLARRAARESGVAFETLLGWQAYSDRVVLIAADGRKYVVPMQELTGNPMEEE